MLNKQKRKMVAAALRCTTCNNDLFAPKDGDESTLQRHRQLQHLKCEVRNRFYTPRRWQEHDILYHPHGCDLCPKTFTKAASLARHKNKVHRRYQCPFCPISMMDKFYSGPVTLQNHVEQTHHGKMVHHCNDCSSVYASEVNYRRRMAIVHTKQCK